MCAPAGVAGGVRRVALPLLHRVPPVPTTSPPAAPGPLLDPSSPGRSQRLPLEERGTAPSRPGPRSSRPRRGAHRTPFTHLYDSPPRLAHRRVSGQFSVWFHTFSSGSLLLVSVPSPHLARTRQVSSPGPLGAISCVMLWPLQSGGPGPAEPPRWAAREAATLGQSVGDMKWPVHLGSSFCSLVLAPEP